MESAGEQTLADRRGVRQPVAVGRHADRLLFADRSALDRGQAVVEELPLHAVRLTLRDRVGNREQIGLAVGEREGTFLVRSDPAAPVSSELLAAQRRLRGDTPLAHGQAGGG